MQFEFSGTAFAQAYMQLLILITTNNNEVLTMSQEKPPLDPHPLSEYVAWAGSRNREPLLGVLKEKLPKDPGNVLELASGNGMHINYFAPHFEHLHFHPSDKDQATLLN